MRGQPFDFSKKQFPVSSLTMQFRVSSLARDVIQLSVAGCQLPVKNNKRLELRAGSWELSLTVTRFPILRSSAQICGCFLSFDWQTAAGNLVCFFCCGWVGGNLRRSYCWCVGGVGRECRSRGPRYN